MSTAPIFLSDYRLHPEVETQCSVTVVYQDTPGRERAIWLCHHLVREFWAEIDFKFNWWRFRYLAEAGIAEAAAQAAADSDIIIVSARVADELPREVRDWFDSWTVSRESREAALVVLTDSRTESDLNRSPSIGFIRAVAERAGVDCLFPLLHSAPYVARDPARELYDRAHHVTEVLDEILHHLGPPPPSPSHWGINE
jgi:hypothetical protein